MVSAALGAKVIATAGTEEKLQVCKSAGGADVVLDYTKSGWQKEVLKVTNGKGVGESQNARLHHNKHLKPFWL